MKASCDEDHPLVERLAAASFLIQLLVTHHAAGGVDPRRAQAHSDIIQRGAPLAVARSKRAKMKSWRGAKDPYFSGAMTFVRKNRLKVKLSQQARLAERPRLLKVHGSMDAEEKSEYVREEVESFRESLLRTMDSEEA